MDNTNPIRKYYVVPIVIIILSILAFSRFQMITRKQLLASIGVGILAIIFIIRFLS